MSAEIDRDRYIFPLVPVKNGYGHIFRHAKRAKIRGERLPDSHPFVCFLARVGAVPLVYAKTFSPAFLARLGARELDERAISI